ncbi:MAG: electron transfer flavoprotein subunit beta [Ruthenibacterium sp.]
MDILVFVKQVPDDFVEVHLDAETKTPATSGIEHVNNAFDTYAVELAVRYCAENGGSVTVAALGEEDAKNNMKNLLAVGAKKAFLFSCLPLDTADESSIAQYLAAAVKKCEIENGAKYGMIFCGKESTDEISGQVGAMLAEKLKLGFVSSVIEVSSCNLLLTAKQETEDGYALYETQSPAVFTIAKPGYDPRYPTIKSKMMARKAEIPVFSAQAAAIEKASSYVICKSYAEPPKRAAGVRIQEKIAADAALKAVATMLSDKVL